MLMAWRFAGTGNGVPAGDCTASATDCRRIWLRCADGAKQPVWLMRRAVFPDGAEADSLRRRLTANFRFRTFD